jgi:TP901 family phage tail tape measure protein
LRGFSLDAEKDSMYVADMLAKTSAKSNTSIASLGESMKVVGPLAEGLGISLKNTSVMVGIMGNAGIKGSLAGNALKAALQRLSKEPPQVTAALDKLDISTRDAQGNLRTMPSLMTELSAKMKNMGKADQMKYLTQIFGSQAAPAMLAVMKACINDEKAFKKLDAELSDVDGASQEMAEIMNATAQGAMKRLGSATESLSITVGNVLLPPLTLIIDKLAIMISGASELAERYPRVTKVIVGLAAALGAAKVGLTVWRLATLAAKLPVLALQLAMAKTNASMVLNGNTSVWMAAKTRIVSAATRAWTATQGAWNAVMGAALSPIGLIIIGIAALVAFGVWLYKNWDRVAANWSVAWGSMKKDMELGNYGDAIMSALAAPLTTIMTLIKDIVAAWDNLMNKIGIGGNTEATMNALEGAQARISSGEYQMGDDMLGSSASWAQAPHALGGIFNTPHIGLVAEAGSEAIIPLSDRSRGIPLWMAAGEEMGMRFGNNSTTTNNITGGSPNINITVNGGDPGIAQRVAEEVKRALREIQEYNDRTQLA